MQQQAGYCGVTTTVSAVPGCNDVSAALTGKLTIDASSAVVEGRYIMVYDTLYFVPEHTPTIGRQVKPII